MSSLFRSLAWLLTLLAAFVTTVHAEQRRYVIGTTVDLNAGSTNRLASTSLAPNQNQPTFFFYGVLPSITMASSGSRSSINASYSYGFSRTKSEQSFEQHSHGASINFSTPLTSELQ